ncbi:hypothetical protein [Neptuniibacter sp. QD37_11]|uniref:hypothetical protein n=1 Tax=Neptuniibacter sp. QD37_11 TaxID=3398209 RepID=UPI0039F607A4
MNPTRVNLYPAMHNGEEVVLSISHRMIPVEYGGSYGAKPQQKSLTVAIQLINNQRV